MDQFLRIIKQMSFILQKSILLALLITWTWATLCPTGSMTVQSFNKLTGDDFASTSQHYDSVYEIQYDSTTQKYTLLGYKLSEVESTAANYFDVKTFTLNVNSTSQIVSISKLGTCLIVQNRPSLLVYSTSGNAFNLVQTITADGYTNAQTNEDCSIVRVTIGGVEKVYQNSVQNTALIFPSNSLFDSYLLYGVGTSKNLMKTASTGMTTITLDSSAIEDTPVSILNRKDLNALIFVTKSSLNSEYTLTVVNTKTQTKVYSKTWLSTQYSGTFSAQLSTEGNYILVRDSNGFLLLLEISYSEASGVQVVEDSLEENTYSSSFSDDAVISLTSNAVITYYNKTMGYFQPYNKYLYFLGVIAVDLESQAQLYANLSSDSAPLIPTFLGPSEFKSCYPSSNTSEQDIAKDVENGGTKVIIDTTGNVIKCEPSCLQCKSVGKCQVCSLGYVLSSSGKCIYCKGCRTCLATNSSICLSCFKPQIFDSTANTCNKPTCADPYCDTCVSGGTCQACLTGFSLYNGTCTKCPDGCPTCTSSLTECDKGSCKYGYVYYQSPTNSSKYTCVECATGCIRCSIDDISNCTSCNEGFFGVKNVETSALRCTACMDNCRNCTSAEYCIRCKSGYTLNSNRTQCTQNCDDTCLTCNKNSTASCTSCYAGSTLSGDKCIADLTCNSFKNCTACGDGYSLVDSQCVQCTYTDKNCMACDESDISQCSKCVAGYYLNEDRTCIQCKSSCATCLNENACLSCNAGYYIRKADESVTGLCLTCNSICKTCNQFEYLCTSCNDGYFLDGSKCISNDRVDYNVTFAAEIGQVVIFSTNFVKLVYNYINNNLVDKIDPLATQDVSINKLKQGSSIVSGSLSTKTQIQSTFIANSLSGYLFGKEVDGYPILSVSTSQIKSNSNSATTQSSESDSNLGLILGIVIPLGLLILVGLVIFFVRMYKRQYQTDKEDSHQEKFVEESQKQIKYSDQTDQI